MTNSSIGMVGGVVVYTVVGVVVAAVVGTVGGTVVGGTVVVVADEVVVADDVVTALVVTVVSTVVSEGRTVVWVTVGVVEVGASCVAALPLSGSVRKQITSTAPTTTVINVIQKVGFL